MKAVCGFICVESNRKKLNMQQGVEDLKTPEVSVKGRPHAETIYRKRKRDSKKDMGGVLLY